MRGRKPRPSALTGNRSEREPTPPNGLPRCPGHLSDVARKEWRRLARPLHDMAVLSTVDRAALAAYCQSYGRWVEAERKLKETPLLLKTPSGYVQQSPWLSISNKQLELMGRYMTELGLTPSARSRIKTMSDPAAHEPIRVIFRTIYDPKDDTSVDAEEVPLPVKVFRP